MISPSALRVGEAPAVMMKEFVTGSTGAIEESDDAFVYFQMLPLLMWPTGDGVTDALVRLTARQV